MVVVATVRVEGRARRPLADSIPVTSESDVGSDLDDGLPCLLPDRGSFRTEVLRDPLQGLIGRQAGRPLVLGTGPFMAGRVTDPRAAQESGDEQHSGPLHRRPEGGASVCRPTRSGTRSRTTPVTTRAFDVPCCSLVNAFPSSV